MPIQICVATGQEVPREVESLRRWLEVEAGLRGLVGVERPPVGTGQMGSLTDTLTVALSAGSAATVLARSLTTWLRQRRSDVRIDITAGDGTQVSVTADRVQDAPALIETVLRSDQGSRDATATSPEAN
ncbi:hypothetical protein MHW47_02290 [Streptomyces sp. OfavH-34-F]|uniref:effector-associated constant component EACC1 n=1 Tax=Streptomyces sp. OfavH-34-F TaxID=2917760 RepID=UPI001EF312DA|nr:hypothetical protein [Streptomyces sp. OfavH-34-F]MCG7523283.1 hypothetical protein [Streptomyces sp. OfavH-34-F]